MTTITGFVTDEPDQEQYTPPEIVIAAKDTLGTIDLDPCTTELVNKVFIRAKYIYTKEQNGLNRELPWQGKVFINPPGGNKHPQHFWERLIIEHVNGNVHSGVFLAFNIEHLQQSQHWTYHLGHYPFCIPCRKLTFYEESRGVIVPRKIHSGMSSAVIYVGKNVNRFVNAFSNIGDVVIPRNTQ